MDLSVVQRSTAAKLEACHCGSPPQAPSPGPNLVNGLFHFLLPFQVHFEASGEVLFAYFFTAHCHVQFQNISKKWPQPDPVRGVPVLRVLVLHLGAQRRHGALHQ
jgi:hypothetical protein